MHRHSTETALYLLQVHFARLPELDNAVGPGVVSSDRHGNELVTIGTQTTEVVMSAECAYEPSVENVRGCSKAATPQQLSDFYHGAWPIVGKYPSTLLISCNVASCVE